MKKYFVSLLAAMSIMCSISPVSTNAVNENKIITSSTIEYYADGSYSVITISENVANVTSTTKSGSKTYTKKDSSGATEWTYTINGTFSYDGSSSSCTSVSDSYSINKNNWSLNSRYHWKNGNTAYGSVTMDYKYLGLTTNSVTRDLTLSCSANGTLS